MAVGPFSEILWHKMTEEKKNVNPFRQEMQRRKDRSIQIVENYHYQDILIILCHQLFFREKFWAVTWVGSLHMYS